MTAVKEAVLTRDIEAPFTLERATDGTGDGLTLEGYAAVFNRVAHIDDHDGIYDEVIAPGAFKRTLNANPRPPLMFEHGRHPLIGKMPIGAIRDLREDPRGLFVRAQLFDNWMIHPLRDAIRDQAVNGMSFRFEIPRGGATETSERGTKLRTIREAKLYELGPVVFPAYADTKVALRSLEAAVPAIHIHLRDDEGELLPDGESVKTSTIEAIQTLWGLDHFTDVLMLDFTDGNAVFAVMPAGEYPGLWQVSYNYDGATGEVTVAAPQKVQAVMPRDSEPDGSTRDLGTSTEPADSTSTEPAADGNSQKHLPRTPNERRQYARKIEASRRGIRKETP